MESLAEDMSGMRRIFQARMRLWWNRMRNCDAYCRGDAGNHEETIRNGVYKVATVDKRGPGRLTSFVMTNPDRR